MPKVVVAEKAGACYGVERALELAREAAESAQQCVTLGPLIHNPKVVDELRAQGVGIADTPEDVTGGTVIIRSHGVVPAVIDELTARGIHIVDATCPYVAKVQHAAENLTAEGYFVVVVGEEGHPEVEGICAYAGSDVLVADSVDKIPSQLPSHRIGVVVQTTQTMKALTEVVSALLPQAYELRVHNTICQATQQRQEAARALAAQVEAMVVVGGRNSGNTTRLAQICREQNVRTYHIEDAEEIDPAWFAGVGTVGVTAGASTPLSQIESVVARIESL